MICIDRAIVPSVALWGRRLGRSIATIAVAAAAISGASVSAVQAAPGFTEQAAYGAAGQAAYGNEPAIVSDEVVQICRAHGPNCRCPSCSKFFDACKSPCPSRGGPRRCPPGATRPTPSDAPPTDDEGNILPTPDTADDGLADEARPAPDMGPVASLPSGLGAIPSSMSASPGMIGDFFVGGSQYGKGTLIPGAMVAVASGDRIMKVSDNNSPIPQNRVFFNYNLFSNAAQDVNLNVRDVNRFTFGAERTFLDDLCSLEFRVPFTAGVDATQIQGINTDGAEFGNLSLTFKALFFERCNWAASGGLAMIFPTADDAELFGSDTDIQSTFTNDSFFLQPFLGVNYRSRDPLFFQFFTAANFDTSGSQLTIDGGGTFFPGFSPGPLTDRVFTQSLLFVDFSAGYWIYRPRCKCRGITGIAPMVELHYTTTMDEIDLPGFQMGANVFARDLRSDQLNLTCGLLVKLGCRTALRVAGVAPLREGRDRTFDSEVSAQLVRNY